MLNKYKGCLLGLTVGDALGAPVDFTLRIFSPAAFLFTGILRIFASFPVPKQLTFKEKGLARPMA